MKSDKEIVSTTFPFKLLGCTRKIGKTLGFIVNLDSSMCPLILNFHPLRDSQSYWLIMEIPLAPYY